MRHPIATAVIGLMVGAVAASAATGKLVVRRQGIKVELEATLPAGVARAELRIASDRNAAMSKFSDVSPLDPKKAPPRRACPRETWYPVVDVELSADMEGVAVFDPVDGGFYSVNALTRREKDLVKPLVAIPSNRLEYWENSIWLDPDGTRLKQFYLRRQVASENGMWRGTLRLLSEDWGGTLTLHAGGSEIARAEIPRPNLALRAIPAGALERKRLIESLAATVAFTVRSHYRNPASAFDGGLHMFYDLDARTYRSMHWIWGYGPSVKLLLDAAKVPEVASRFAPGELVKVADAIGKMTLRFSEKNPIDMMVTSRWERHPDQEYGHREAITPADAGFIMGWAWIPLYEATGDARYLEASKCLAASIARLCKEWGLIPQNFWLDSRSWGDTTIDESGFGTEGLAELYRVTKAPKYRDLSRGYMEQILAKLERPDGLWDRGYDRSTGRRSPTARMTRGLGWAMEGLLANHRLDPEGRWLGLARRMGDHLLAAQQKEGYWAFNFDRPASEVGISEKGTALWSLLFYRTYAASGDSRCREAARRALRWCIDNQYGGPDPEAHGGIIGVSPHSAVGYRAWYRVACTYASGFLGLAVLEELRQCDRPSQNVRVVVQ